MFWAGQIVGFFAIISLIISVQCKKKVTILAWMIVNCVLFSVSLALLQAFSGAAMCLFALIPTILVYYFEKKSRKFPNIIAYFCMLAAVAAWAFTYKTPWDLLSIAAIWFYILSIIQKSENRVRWLLLGNILCWMIYDFVFKAWTPFLSDIFFTISCVIALIRFRKKSGNSQKGKEKEGK